MTEQLRRIDLIDVFEAIDAIDIPVSGPDCSWDEQAQCFWVRLNTPIDTWLRLQGI
jgi:hypothetical protein